MEMVKGQPWPDFRAFPDRLAAANVEIFGLGYDYYVLPAAVFFPGRRQPAARPARRGVLRTLNETAAQPALPAAAGRPPSAPAPVGTSPVPHAPSARHSHAHT